VLRIEDEFGPEGVLAEPVLAHVLADLVADAERLAYRDALALELTRQLLSGH
jgi:hypothetical protein